jgi:hypothetical protein
MEGYYAFPVQAVPPSHDSISTFARGGSAGLESLDTMTGIHGDLTLGGGDSNLIKWRSGSHPMENS